MSDIPFPPLDKAPTIQFCYQCKHWQPEELMTRVDLTDGGTDKVVGSIYLCQKDCTAAWIKARMLERAN